MTEDGSEVTVPEKEQEGVWRCSLQGETIAEGQKHVAESQRERDGFSVRLSWEQRSSLETDKRDVGENGKAPIGPVYYQLRLLLISPGEPFWANSVGA